MTNNTLLESISTSTKTLFSTTIINEGLFRFNGSSIVLNLSNGALLQNNPAGTLDIQSSTSSGIYMSGTGGFFDNYGLLLKSADNGYDISANFRNLDGTIDVQSGSLNFEGSPVHEFIDGNYSVATDCSIRLDNTSELVGSLSGTIDGHLSKMELVRLQIRCI